MESRKKEIRRTAIVGMGALGLMYARQITQQAGRESVTFLMDERRLQHHAGDVYTVNGQEQHFVMADAAKAEPFDLVIVAVKYGALAGVVREMARAVGPDTVIISVMNGISSERILAQRYERDHIIDCVAIGMDAMRQGTSLSYTRMGKLQIGVTSPAQQGSLDRLVRFFERVQMPHEVVPDIRYAMWNKFMLNVGINQACTVYATDYQHATDPGPICEEMREAMREVIALAQAQGIPLGEADLERAIAIEQTLKPDGYPSMRQDVVAGRRTEVEMFAGEVIAQGERLGIPTPVNRRYAQAIRAIEERLPG